MNPIGVSDGRKDFFHAWNDRLKKLMRIRLKEKLVKAGLEDKMELKDIFAQYKDLFGTEKPLGLKEFYTVLKIAFPQPPPVESAVASGQMDDLVLQNVKYAPSKSADGELLQLIAWQYKANT